MRIGMTFLLGLAVSAAAWAQDESEQPEWLDGSMVDVLLTCDARGDTLEARLVYDEEERAALRENVDPEGDPLRAVVLAEASYDIFNTQVIRIMEGEEYLPEGLAETEKDMVALVSQPTVMRCGAYDGSDWVSGEFTVTRVPGNFNPMGRCGASEKVQLTVSRDGDSETIYDLIGDCHYGNAPITKVVMDLKTGETVHEGGGEVEW